ncbi:MAG TPA: outer membrane protein transport protein [Kofleriaceae bacterium]|nr:outer membrane protein transport protein [Kofleriaceae bacterium]
MRSLVVLVLMSATAHADPLDLFGFGAEAAGQAGARTASATGAEAAHYDPAAVALAERPTVLVGWGAAAMRLSIDGRDADVLDAHGTSLGLAVPIHDGDWTYAGAIGLYLPDQFLARIHLIPPTEPHFVLLDNDPHRVVVEPIAAASYRGRFAIGGGASILADASSRQIVFDVGIVAGQKVGEAALDIELPVRAAPLLGVWMRPHDRVRLAATYRGQLSLDLRLDILANVQVAGVVTGDALVSIRAANYFTPARAQAGVAIDVADDLTVAADLAWQRWSAFGSGLPDLRVLVALDLTPPLVSTQNPPARFTDTIETRLGAEYRRAGDKTDLALRAGAAYLPSPVPPQTGLTSFADGDRTLLTLGAGLTFAHWQPYLTRPLSIDLAIGWQHVAPRLTKKDVTSFPGEAFSSDGEILQASLSSTIHF